MFVSFEWPTMDDFVTLLKNEQSNARGLLLEILSSGYEEWKFIAAVEGQDDMDFYYDFLKDYLGTDEINFIDCKGKKSVVDLKNIVDEYNWEKKPDFLFLCDKDFDDILSLKADGIYYTPSYSIESFLAQGDYLEGILKKHSRPPLRAADRRTFLEQYEHIFANLVTFVRPYAAYMCEIRAKSIHPLFDKVGIDKLLSFQGGKASRRSDRLAEINQLLEIAPSITWQSITSRAKSFALENWRLWLRGKLALQIARKSFELAAKSMSEKIRRSLPSDPKLSRDGMASAYLSLKPISCLKEYCSAL
jgi:hypothetical protein